jgi:uncharacterized protein (TIGR02444 family)
MGRILADCLPNLGKISSQDYLVIFPLFFSLCCCLFLKATMSARDQSLWDFCLALYSRPAIEQICLHLQDQWGANVNVVLWLCWLADRGVPVDQQQLDLALQKLASWHDDVVAPLRQLRRLIKQRYPHNPDGINDVRMTVKKAELAAEKVELDWLEEFASGWKITKVNLSRADNLCSYFKQLGLTQTCFAEACDILQNHPKPLATSD